MKIYKKLVRDKVVEQAREKGVTVVARILVDDTEFLTALANKLVEEAGEFRVSLSAQVGSLAEELADVIEVAMTLTDELTTLKHLEEVRRHKAQTLGGFTRRIFLESVEEPE